MPEVRLVDLDIIKRFSLAVRRDSVPAEEVLASLDASRAVVVAALGRRTTPRPAAARGRTGTKQAAPAAAARKARKAPTKAAAAPKKAVAKTTTRRRAPGS
jgi:hypothetical protein